MATDTDIRLRSRLDSNQRDREQMCRAVLALDARYTEVRPRHPLGGPDGGRDIEALFSGTLRTFGAVGFANSANDPDDQKKQTRRKFRDDLTSAIAAEPAPKASASGTPDQDFFADGRADDGALDRSHPASPTPAKSLAFLLCSQ